MSKSNAIIFYKNDSPLSQENSNASAGQMPVSHEVKRGDGIGWSRSIMEYLHRKNLLALFFDKGTQEDWLHADRETYKEIQRFTATQSVRDLIEKRMQHWLIEG